MRKKFCGLIFRSYIFLVESLISQSNSSEIQIDFSKPVHILVDGTGLKQHILQASIKAPSNGIVWVLKSSNTYHNSGGINSSGYTRSSYTYCNISGYGTVSSGNARGMFIVSKGDTISLGYEGDAGSGGSTGYATFFPFK